MNGDPNLSVVELAAKELGALTNELVLVGGCAVGLLVTDIARTPVRHTVDVDMLTEVTPLASYYQLVDKLRQHGFSEQVSDGVICRWIKGTLVIDVMPTDEAILGFTNSWYRPAAQHAVEHVLPSGRIIRHIAAPYFLATKFEAFASRGNGDYTHHDMEDIITIIDGRTTIVNEMLRCDASVRTFVMDELEALLADPLFVDRVSWLIPTQELEARRTILLTRMRQIVGL